MFSFVYKLSEVLQYRTKIANAPISELVSVCEIIPSLVYFRQSLRLECRINLVPCKHIAKTKTSILKRDNDSMSKPASCKNETTSSINEHSVPIVRPRSDPLLIF